MLRGMVESTANEALGWIEEASRILVGDCIALMAALPEASVDAIFADPP